MKNGIKYKYISAFVAVALLLISFVIMWGGVGGKAYAATNYSGVVSDLEKDSTFKKSDYPSVSTNYGFEVIQIAESENGDLLLYVYQPAAVTTPLIATSINMSLSETVDGTKLYNLRCVSTDGVFQKYIVDGVTVSTVAKRYYNITSIHRKFNSKIDKGTGNNNVKNEIAYKVGVLYCAKTKNGNISYSADRLETVEIKSPYHDFLRYRKGMYWWMDNEFIDSHYVAFSTNLSIDSLISATLSYSTQASSQVFWGNESHLVKEELKDPVPHEVTLTDTDTGNLNTERPLGLFYANNTEFSRIQSVDEFLKGDKYIKLSDFTDETKKILNQRQWVLRFAEFQFSENIEQGFCFRSSTVVSEVTVLRLEFKMNGKTYNLGAVSDTVTGDDKPGNKNSSFNLLSWLADKIGIPEWSLYVILGIIALLIVLAILSPFIPIIKDILYWAWFVITSPFRLIVLIVKKIKGGDDSD